LPDHGPDRTSKGGKRKWGPKNRHRTSWSKGSRESGARIPKKKSHVLQKRTPKKKKRDHKGKGQTGGLSKKLIMTRGGTRRPRSRNAVTNAAASRKEKKKWTDSGCNSKEARWRRKKREGSAKSPSLSTTKGGLKGRGHYQGGNPLKKKKGRARETPVERGRDKTDHRERKAPAKNSDVLKGGEGEWARHLRIGLQLDKKGGQVVGQKCSAHKKKKKRRLRGKKSNNRNWSYSAKGREKGRPEKKAMRITS